MAKFIIEGGQRLFGEIRAQGSKNAAFPVLAACLLASSPSRIENIPDIKDVHNFLDILKFLGARVQWQDHAVTIDPQGVENRVLTSELMGKLRGSIVLAGALLARFHAVKFSPPGGDAIGQRPIDQHLEGFRRLGAVVQESATEIDISASDLIGAKIVLGFSTVTGTENLILAAQGASGETNIRLAACEPHIQTLCNFLIKMGARIEGVGTPNLKIFGGAKLQGATYVLNFDEIATMTFAVSALATHGEIKILDVDPSMLDAPLGVLQRMGAEIISGLDFLQVKSGASALTATKVVTGVYPQLLTDYQPLLGVLATQAQGDTKIHDWIYEGRQGYLRSLSKMGANVVLEDNHRSRIHGPTPLYGVEIKTPDIRAGASILIAALIAKGQSILYNAEIIDRGYERLDDQLNLLGARIQRVI